MARAIFAPAAEGDLTEIYTFIASDNRAAAWSTIELLEQKTTTLAAAPGLGRAREELQSNLRSLAVGNYVIFYRPSPDGIEVVRVLHGKRDIEAIFAEESDEV